ncbi:MAG TPA: O-antigen ligase family protein [Methyloceanibacter sp.]|nr:O-antigen ligase family protein [Methyloceanibacter sp.]
MEMVEGEAGHAGPIGRLLFRLEAGLLGFLCLASPAFPRLLPFLLGVLGVNAAIHVFTTEPKRPLALLRTPIGIAIGLFVAYLFVNSALTGGAGFSKAAATLGLLAAGFLVAASVMLRDPRQIRVLAKSALAGLLFGVAFLLIELAFDEPVKRFVANHGFRLFDLAPKKVVIVNGEIVKVKASVLNRNVTSLVLLLIPGLLFAGALPARLWRQGLLAVLVVAAAICVFISESGTSIVAFVLSAAVLGSSALSLKATRVGLMAAWTIAMVFAVPLAALPYERGWNRWTWLPPESVAARFYIWKHMADQVGTHPVIGLGIRGARDLKLQLPADSKRLQEANPVADGRRVPHPHNIFLQIWLELGAIGAVLALGIGLVALWQIGTLPALVQAGANGLFAAGAAVAASGFDLWQTWLFASYVAAWVAIVLAKRLATGGASGQGNPGA